MTDLIQYSATQLVALLRSNQISIADTLDAVKDRIAAVDEPVNALPTRCFERAYQNAEQLQAKPADQRGLLCGVPVTIKDLMPVGDVRTTFGCKIFEDFIPPVSDQVVRRIEHRGGVIYAKSNTPEFGAGGITFNDVFGQTLSPHNVNYAAGGSSGGAAASLASGTAWLSHGSDMAGSLRTPASFCGVCSLRPSPATMPADSEYLPFQVLGAEGPMARNIADLALFADAMRIDPSEQMQTALANNSVKSAADITAAFSLDLGITQVSDEIAQAFTCYKESLTPRLKHSQDAQPVLKDVHNSFDVLRANIFAVGLESALHNNPDIMKPELVWNIQQGIALDSSAIRQALRQQGQLVKHSARFMQDVDVLICPAVSTGSVKADLRYPGQDRGVAIADYYRWLAIAYASTMMALPIITLPVGIVVSDSCDARSTAR